VKAAVAGAPAGARTLLVTAAACVVGIVTSTHCNASSADLCDGARGWMVWLSSGVEVEEKEKGRAISESELEQLAGPGPKRDPWDRPWRLGVVPGARVYSAGRNGVPGDHDDIRIDARCPYVRVDIGSDGVWRWVLPSDESTATAPTRSSSSVSRHVAIVGGILLVAMVLGIVLNELGDEYV